MTNGFFSLPPELMSALATVLGFALLGDLSSDEQYSLSSFFMLIGQVLQTTGAQKQLLTDLAQAQVIAQLEVTVGEIQKQLQELQQRLPNPPTALPPQSAP